MFLKYIVALLALSPAGYIDFAQKHFSKVAAGYLLGAKSAPHITVAQFYADQSSYNIIKDHVTTITTSIMPRFIGISFVGDAVHPDIWWAELSVARDSALLALHQKMINFLKMQKMKIINDHEDLYRPHLTLARIHATSIHSSCPNLAPSPFILVLGQADELGQLVNYEQIPYSYEKYSCEMLKS